MKIRNKIIQISLLLIVLTSMTKRLTTSESEFLGTWKWVHLKNTETNEILGIDAMTMGLAKEVKTEFKKDSTYSEYKSKGGEEGYSKTEGRWELADSNKVLKMNTGKRWQSSKIIYFSKDSMIIEMRKPLQLLMIKEKE